VAGSGAGAGPPPMVQPAHANRQTESSSKRSSDPLLRRRPPMPAYLFISHDLKVIRAVSDEILVMRDGRVVEQGPTERIFEQPEQA
jgi:ABC-type multidrug transport system fused ATPase/permease subunit